MTRPAHTPAPWTLCERGDYSDFDGQSRVILGPVDGEPMSIRLAVVQVSDGDFFDESEANARLIAAAPELLEALQEVAACMLNGGDGEKGDYGWIISRLTKARPMIRAAIAKAHGDGQ